MIQTSSRELQIDRHWETALDAVNDGVCLLGPDGSVASCNTRATRILKSSHEDIIGRPATQVLARSFGHIRPERVAYLDKVPRPRRVEVERNGSIYQITVVPALDDQGSLVGSVLTLTDTTQQRRLEAEEKVAAGLRQQASRMSSLDQMKSQFLRLASHELRGPLAVFSGYLSMLEDGALGELPPAALQAMRVMSGKVGEMNQLIEQLLDVARLEDSRLALKRQHLDLREVLAEAEKAVQYRLDERHPLLIVGPDEEVPVLADRMRLRIILSNLIENAVKYSPAGGRIECVVSQWQQQASVTVRDHGVGIRPDDRDLLFSRFGRIVNEQTVGIEGAGLGLYLSRELARMHGGDLTVESTPGEGSSFTLSLPLAEQASSPRPVVSSD